MFTINVKLAEKVSGRYIGALKRVRVIQELIAFINYYLYT